MNRQLILENFITATHGLGQGLFPGTKSRCAYFPESHPGCAIGCQPKFKEQFKGKINVDIGIVELLAGNKGLEKKLISFFKIKGDGDIQFLSSMQDFHDEPYNWNDDGTIKKKHLDEFCDDWELNSNFSKN